MKYPRFILSSLIALAIAAAISGCGKSAAPTSAVPTLDTAPPQAPSGLTVVTDPASGLEVLQWSPNSEADLARYQICLYSPSPDRDNAYLPVAEATQASMWLPTVGESVTYYYRVRAVDQSGNASALSALLTVHLNATGPGRDPQPDDPPPVLVHH